MTFARLASGAALLLATALPAVAADIVAPAMVEPAFEARWTGFYVGVVGGYHDGDIDFTNCVGLCPANPGFDTWSLGVQAGYDYQFSNNVVVGAYASIPLLTEDDSFNIGLPGFDFTVDARFSAFLGGRIGYDFDGFMPYIAGGYNVAFMKGTSFFGVSRDNTHHGAHIAVGAEYLWTDYLSTDVRYTYAYFGKETYDFGGGASNWGESSNNFRAAINYRF